MRRLLLILLPVCLFTTSRAVAQRPIPPVGPGMRVRLIVVDTVAATRDVRFTYPEGTIAGFDDRSLVLRPDRSSAQAAGAADALRVPVTRISSAEASTGMKRHAVHGAGVGVVVGAVAGYLLGRPAKGAGEACTTIGGADFCTPLPAERGTQVSTAASVAGIGVLAGAAVGYFIRTERWAKIDLAHLRFQVGL